MKPFTPAREEKDRAISLTNNTNKIIANERMEWQRCDKRISPKEYSAYQSNAKMKMPQGRFVSVL